MSLSAPTPRVAIIVVAAGSGTRLGEPLPKAFVELDGRSILSRSLDPIFGLAEPAQVVVVAPSTHSSEARDIVEQAAGQASDACTVVVGGDSRQASVAAGLAVLEPSVEVVLVHDAARALAPRSLFERVVVAVDSSGRGAIPGLAVSDTIKRVDASSTVLETVDRSQLSAVQTPQAFPRAELVAAYAAADREFTDDAALIQHVGGSVAIVAGDPLAFKITTPWDLRRAAQLLAEGSSSGRPQASGPAFRTGVGVDAHAFDDGQPLWIAGLFWPGEAGLAGHSDGDAVAHALCDALLSAAGLADIGGIFGVDDPRLEGAHAEVFLVETLRLLHDSGFAPVNASVQLVGNRPRFAPRKAEAQERLTALLGCPVSVSATTTDSLGFTGRGEGIAAIATALIAPLPRPAAGAGA
ncbi:2-C-methyl-D-erythritol 4-phosphate cytidylyltransferase [Agreia sp. PsM10]|uniref:2-C-methyl-D-erythritol 4-phosphate cytidylyltransferase n=1 Tax=Agreia sp. PsM10 TaxID=3030533 RepID=UPI00263B4D6A|nr:2-C-methyl-D-erythritol 4-phosphate cytidylyltransferase [Agreia sp. PsM10]MDN4641694.1 2-C-methyl-D-erythritol 4-phosphate cytidylyltransferase [Agreia sp. PsM10]